MIVVGLMSGTSADGVDAALARFQGASSTPKWELLNFVSIPYANDLRKLIIRTNQGVPLSSFDLLELSEVITESQAQAVNLCDPDGLADLVGCHGQTLWHRPPSNGRRGASLQVVQASLLAELVRRPVVNDFRAADISIGGQGAPLVPMPDVALLGRISGWRAVLNLGGISNLTFIPPRSGPDRAAFVLGWDCGPANSLLDLTVEKITKGVRAFDCNGEIAARGNPDEALVQRWLKEPFFQVEPPKSTGREQFGISDLNKRLHEMSSLSEPDQMATLTSFSAAIVAQDVEKLFAKRFIRPLELIVSGGGSLNQVLMQELKARCNGVRVLAIDEYGIPSEAREALAFALLAWWHHRKHPGNAPSITGSSRTAVLGVRTDPI